MLYFIFGILLFQLITKDAYAYIDPGAGSFFFQTIIAVVLGGLYVVKVYWAKIKKVVRELIRSVASLIIKK